MKELVDIHTILSTPSDMEDVHDDPVLASEKLNCILHTVYMQLDDNFSTQYTEIILGYIWEYWHQDIHLAELDDDDMIDWVNYISNNLDTIIEEAME